MLENPDGFGRGSSSDAWARVLCPYHAIQRWDARQCLLLVEWYSSYQMFSGREDGEGQANTGGFQLPFYFVDVFSSTMPRRLSIVSIVMFALRD